MIKPKSDIAYFSGGFGTHPVLPHILPIQHKLPAHKISSPILPNQWTARILTLGLTRRQEKIVELILQGKSDKRIAIELGLKKSTVHTYMKRIFGKLNIVDRPSLLKKVFVLPEIGTASVPNANA